MFDFDLNLISIYEKTFQIVDCNSYFMIFTENISSVYDTNLKTVLINLFKIYNRFDSNLNLSFTLIYD